MNIIILFIGIQQEWLELNFNDDTTENLTEDLIKKGLEIGLEYAKAPPKKRKLIDRLLCSDVQNIIHLSHDLTNYDLTKFTI